MNSQSESSCTVMKTYSLLSVSNSLKLSACRCLVHGSKAFYSYSNLFHTSILEVSDFVRSRGSLRMFIRRSHLYSFPVSLDEKLCLCL